jgi:YbbR domain-containing protein
MNWRDFFVTNRWQKLFSLVLATLIWLTVRSGIELAPLIEDLGHDARQFERLPITVLTSATDLGHYRVEPERVTVVLRGDRLLLEQVQAAQLEVYVNLVEATGKLGTRPVHVYAPSGTEVVTVQPREVLVERLPDSRVSSEQR